jgi:hypothetical protein
MVAILKPETLQLEVKCFILLLLYIYTVCLFDVGTRNIKKLIVNLQNYNSKKFFFSQSYYCIFLKFLKLREFSGKSISLLSYWGLKIK